MKNSKLLFTFLFLLSAISFSALAQDTIFKKDKTKIYAKIYEVNQDDIKFKDFDNQDGPTFVIEKIEIEKIVFSNGRVMYMTIDPYAVGGDVEVRNKTRAVKFEFFSPLTDDLAFGYEFMYKVGFNVEVKIGIIGVGLVPAPKASGAFVKIGPKFFLGNDYLTPGLKYAHAMRGRYLKPEFSMSLFKRTQEVSNLFGGMSSIEEVQFGNYGISLVYGRQVILGKTITIDWYFGVGYAMQTSKVLSSNNTIFDNSNIDLGTYVYSGYYGGKNAPVLFSGGITVGYLF